MAFFGLDLSIGLEGNHTFLAEPQTGSVTLFKCIWVCCSATHLLALVETGLYKVSLQPALWSFMAIIRGGERGGKMNLENLAIKHITCIYGPRAPMPGIERRRKNIPLWLSVTPKRNPPWSHLG